MPSQDDPTKLDFKQTAGNENNIIGETYKPANDGYMQMTVYQPVLVKGKLSDHHEYPIRGKDSIGEVEIQRRFSTFCDFRACLVLRYPGLYIPPIPPKKIANKTEDALIVERQYFLDLFLKDICTLKYLC